MGLCSKKVTSNDGTLDCSQSLTLHTEAIKCPRCESTNTKFCYYNNYSKTQPRYFCKACKRHWTEGGTLRNIPVGGGRKNRNRRLKTLAPKAAAAHSNRVNSQMPEADHLNNNEAILRQPSSGFQLQDSGFSSVNNLLDGDHLLRGPIPGSFQSFAMEDSSVKAMMPSTSSSITWQAVGNNGEMDYWNWDDIDYLVTTDLNISSWDDATDVKP